MSQSTPYQLLMLKLLQNNEKPISGGFMLLLLRNYTWFQATPMEIFGILGL